MPLDISKLTRFDIGREVTYTSGPDVEHGHLAFWTDKRVYVHFHRGSTAASCKPESLKFSMGGYNENGGESVAEILDELDELRKGMLKYVELAKGSHARGETDKVYGQAEWLRRIAKLIDGWSQQLVSAQMAEALEGDDG